MLIALIELTDFLNFIMTGAILIASGLVPKINISFLILLFELTLIINDRLENGIRPFSISVDGCFPIAVFFEWPYKINCIIKFLYDFCGYRLSNFRQVHQTKSNPFSAFGGLGNIYTFRLDLSIVG